MPQTKGEFSGYTPRLSAKTPVGKEIQSKGSEGADIKLTITEVRADDIEEYLNEELQLTIAEIRDEYIELEDIPRYLQDFSYRYADYVVYEVHTLKDNGRHIELDTESTTAAENTNGTQGKTQPHNTQYSGPPSLEILESITADVLDSLGYQSETNVRRSGREQSSSIEVDVWAETPTENFSVYVSCKNWDSKIDRQAVDKEVGRIMTMQRLPQLRVMVIGELTDGARAALKANGFVPITLGKQADETNADEVYETIHSQLTQTLLAIAPPQVEAIANRAESLSNELSELSDEIRRIGD